MINKLKSLFTCLAIVLLSCSVSLVAQKNTKSNKTDEEISSLYLSKILLDENPPPFYIKPGGVHQLYMEAAGEAENYYWAVYMDLNGNDTFDEEELIWEAESAHRNSIQGLITIPRDWSEGHSRMRIMVSDEPIKSPDRTGGNLNAVDVMALIPFTSQIDTGLDEMIGGCIGEDDLSSSTAPVVLNIDIPARLIPSHYQYINVRVFGYDPSAEPLFFGNNATNYITPFESVPSGRFAMISLSIPVAVNLDSIDGGQIASVNECELLFVMEVRGFKTMFSPPEIFYVEIDEELYMPSIEYVVAPLCECKNSGTQILRMAAESSFKSLNVYPNPINEDVNISYESESSVVAKVWNMNGKLIWSKKLPAGIIEQTINLSHFSSGLYIFELSSADKRERFKLWKR